MPQIGSHFDVGAPFVRLKPNPCDHGPYRKYEEQSEENTLI